MIVLTYWLVSVKLYNMFATKLYPNMDYSCKHI